MLYFIDQEKISPSEHSTMVGRNVTFPVSITATHSVKERCLPKELTSLHIADVKVNNIGYYECVGIIGNGSVFVARGYLKLTVHECFW